MKNYLLSQKGFAPIAIILIVITILVIVGYFLYAQSKCENYSFGRCPFGCISECMPSHINTADCDGPGSCVSLIGKIQTKYKNKDISKQVAEWMHWQTQKNKQKLPETPVYTAIETLSEIWLYSSLELDSSLEFEEKCRTLNGAMYVWDRDRYSNDQTHCYIPFNEKYKKFHALELFKSAILVVGRGYIGSEYIGHKDYTENDEIINNNGFIITLGSFEGTAGYLVDKYIKQRGLAVPFDTSDKKLLIVKGFNEDSLIADKIQSLIDNIICKEKFVKPIDTSKIITDPMSKMQIINNQLLITFNENATFGNIFKKLRALNGEIVGCVLSKDYQVEFPDITFEELKHLKDLFEKNSQIEAVSWNFLVEPMQKQ